MRTRTRERIITGRVSSAGAVVSGTGFTVSRTSAGVYVLRFPGTVGVPAATASQETLGYSYLDSHGEGTVRVTTGGGTDSAFTFTAWVRRAG